MLIKQLWNSMTVANNDSNDNNKNNNLRITSDELKKKIDKGEDIFILDVRNQHDLKVRLILQILCVYILPS